MSNNALATRPETEPIRLKLTEEERQAPSSWLGGLSVLQLGKVLADSGYFQDIKSAAQACVKIMRGIELGIGPIQAIENVHVIQGKTALSAALIGALIKRSTKYDYQILEHTDKKCSILFLEREKEAGIETYTVEDAVKAKLTTRGEMWQKFPKNMLFARAMSNGARWYCAEVFGGAIYTSEEMREVDINPSEQVSQQEAPAGKPGQGNGHAQDPNQGITPGTKQQLQDLVAELGDKEQYGEDAISAQGLKIYAWEILGKEFQHYSTLSESEGQRIKARFAALLSGLKEQEQGITKPTLQQIKRLLLELTDSKSYKEAAYTPEALKEKAQRLLNRPFALYQDLSEAEGREIVPLFTDLLQVLMSEAPVPEPPPPPSPNPGLELDTVLAETGQDLGGKSATQPGRLPLAIAESQNPERFKD